MCPKTCENFRALCTGERGRSRKDSSCSLSYKGSAFHRVVKDGWIQGGDILNSHGNNGEAIYGSSFPDESFQLKHTDAGMVGFCNTGPHSNASQFYITLGPMPLFDQKHVAFGRVVDGMRVAQLISKEPVQNQRPIRPCVVRDCREMVLED